MQATGICGADIGTVRDPAPATGFPVTPGHEVAGVVAESGPDVAGWAVGELVMGARAVEGQLTGSLADTEQAMRFAVTTGVRPVVETVALEGKARFRMVLVPGA